MSEEIKVEETVANNQPNTPIQGDASTNHKWLKRAMWGAAITGLAVGGYYVVRAFCGSHGSTNDTPAEPTDV